MVTKKDSTQSNRGGLLATAIALVCLLGGLILVIVALTSQRPAPQLPAAAGGFRVSVTRLEKALRSSLGAAVSTTGQEDRSSEVVGPTLPRSKPVALRIPAIGVNSRLQYLGQAADGALETPSGSRYNQAAWYRHSPTPGSLGPAILLGHVDSVSNGPSVFYRLGELQPGDPVSITRADDSTAVFIVDKVQNYAKDNFPTKLVYGNISHAGLRILTCGGAFDDTTGHYLENVVVFASLDGSLNK